MKECQDKKLISGFLESLSNGKITWVKLKEVEIEKLQGVLEIIKKHHNSVLFIVCLAIYFGRL